MKKIHWSVLILFAGLTTHPLGGLLSAWQGGASFLELSLGTTVVGTLLASLPFVVPAMLQLSPDTLLVRAANLTAGFLFALSLASQTACFMSVGSQSQAALAFLSLPILLAGIGLLLLPTVYAASKTGFN